MKSLQTVVSGECGKCSMVSTKYGNVCTDHILFICSGAFHSCKPSDMLAELQGRLPIRVQLKGLTQEVNLCLYEFSFSSHRIQLHWSVEDVQWAVFSWMPSKVCAKTWGIWCCGRIFTEFWQSQRWIWLSSNNCWWKLKA